jgi:PAS domain S-box-containing protein
MEADMAHSDSHWSQSSNDPAPERLVDEASIETAIQQSSNAGGEERRFQAIVELAPDAIIVSSADGRIILVNRQTELLFGYERANLLGLPIEVLLPERFHSSHVLRRASYAADPRARPMGSGLQLFGRRKDGSEFPVEVSLSPLDTYGEDQVIATVRDVSELKRTIAAHTALETANQELRQLLALTDTALSSLALDDLMRELLLRARDVMEVDNVAILLLDESGHELQVRAVSGMEEAVSSQVRVPVGQGFAGRIAATREPLVVDDLATFPTVTHLLHERLRSVMGVPLHAGERLLGVLHVGSITQRHFSDQDVHLLELVGERIALAIDRAQLYEATLAARAEAERERARWQAAMDSAPAFVITCDAELRLTYINPTYARLLGPSADLSAPLAERPTRFGLLMPDGSGPIAPEQTPLARAVREQRVIPGFELLYHEAATGAERLVRWDTAPMRADDGSVLGAVSVGWDITEQRRLERAAQEHTTQMEAIFEAVTDGIAVYDLEGRVILSNATFRAQLARFIPSAPAETLRERSAQARPSNEFGALLPEEQWAQTRALRGEVVSGESPVEMIVRATDGAIAVFRVTAAPLRDATGQIIGAVTVIRDATARKRLEREREEARARELATREVNQRLDEFFAIAAHDIRNPVTTVYTSVQLMQRRLKRLRAELTRGTDTLVAAIEALESSLSAARTDVERLNRLVDRLFDIAQARAGKLELALAPCDLAAITREQVAAQRAAAPERPIALALPAERPVPVLGDADRLGEVLANYLTNAHKYSPAARPITVRLEVSGERAVVSVRDEGPGLPLVEQSLVWEMFHRVPGAAAIREAEGQGNSGNSLGLGLHICKRLVEAHPGGEVGVESEVGAGSTFWFSLPLAEAPQQPNADPDANRAPLNPY